MSFSILEESQGAKNQKRMYKESQYETNSPLLIY